MSLIGERAASLAKEWIGTPYHHQARKKQVGCDCLGLIHGIYDELGCPPIDFAPTYSRSWGEADGKELMLEAAQRYLRVKHLSVRNWGGPEPGDILLFRMRKGTVAKHAAIAISNLRMIHAFESNVVAEVNFDAFWCKRTVGVFQFPDI
jgi:NlpC/P60 family putative phage cell wall peptidase